MRLHYHTGPGKEEDRRRLFTDRRRERLAHRQHQVDQGEAEKRGIDLRFSDAQQKQENQIKALRRSSRRRWT